VRRSCNNEDESRVAWESVIQPLLSGTIIAKRRRLSYGNNSIDGNGDRETAPPSVSLK
jgi:hypothetical protein